MQSLLFYSLSLLSTFQSTFASPLLSINGLQQWPNATGPQYGGTPDPRCQYWMEDIQHQGIAAFNRNPSNYTVFRNVKDYGAKGDGLTDDSKAINAAITEGDRCAPGVCNTTTTTPAVVYFPAGTYMVNASIVSYYYTQLIGNPNCPPVIRATPSFPAGSFVVDGNQYTDKGLGYKPVDTFWRQVRNLIIDTTLVPANTSVTALHWPTGQVNQVSNLVFNLSDAPGTQHIGMLCEEGSGGLLTDLVFYGGLIGANIGNQQYTARNLTFKNVVTAINQLWDWGWTYKSITIDNCTIGLNLSNTDQFGLTTGSINFIDSSISNTATGFITGRNETSSPASANTLILENLQLDNVSVVVQGPSGPRLQNTNYVAGWIDGNAYLPNGPNRLEQTFQPDARPGVLVQSDGKYFERSKPQYGEYPLSWFISARDAGAKGDGNADDTVALQNAINRAVNEQKILYIDHGDYLVSSTLYIPAGSKIVGETYSVILSYGSYFDDMENPKPVIQIGAKGEAGSIEWSDTVISTQGRQRGAIMFEYNLIAPAGTPSGLWDVHVRIGGFAGSKLLKEDCPTTPNTTVTIDTVENNCISGYLSMHITPESSGLYLENVWVWIADHDLEDNAKTRVTVYAGRGLLDESQGPVWMIGTGVEHHVLYEYQFVNAKNVWAGLIQTETAYYQPNPNAIIPFPVVEELYDPVFEQLTVRDPILERKNSSLPTGLNSTTSWNTTTPSTRNSTAINIPAANGWGLRVVDSHDILIYGAGLYSFFNNYNTSCSDRGNDSTCQSRVVSIEGSCDVLVYGLATVGVHWPITVDGEDVAYYADNQAGFPQTIAMFQKRSSDVSVEISIGK
ncbi:Glucan 1,3-beta-glucosidase [Cercospora beticola]|uniref:Glucan 1,3-beta-glucosidase n=1 Tax=Cercospora beticola TaxID=122368 RepID=A0A2G5HYA7_CERBT|nr:Glucan 1,3-beta-glucosidase [Cercospora beticola]PIA97500.1 Glucan 1,3-beta-glucosidase [Cercospora beticola]WPA97814.1 hypothetical protein RHO25_002425 [Cercospora beticola]